MSLRSFLAKARAALAAPAAERSLPLTFVVGNESADIDSLCSALVLAYLRTNTPPRTLHIPLSNILRADLALRTEMTAVLARADLAPSHLLTLSELPEQLRPEDTRWLLVDHNALTGQLSRFSRQVTGCIDHHADEKSVPSDAQPRVVEPCGSCISLVVEDSRGIWDEAAAEEQANLARLGLAAILVDTINLTAEHKIKEKDRTAAAFLEEKLAGSEYDRKSFFEDISAVKEDLSSLSFRDVLRKDYKEWTEGSVKIGISSVPQGLEYLLDDKASGSTESFTSAVDEWARERELDVVSVMTTSNAGGDFHRGLFVWARSKEGQYAVKAFIRDASEQLELQTFRDGKLDAGETQKAWGQGNLAASRKQVAPLLREAANKIKPGL